MSALKVILSIFSSHYKIEFLVLPLAKKRPSKLMKYVGGRKYLVLKMYLGLVWLGFRNVEARLGLAR